MSLTAICKRVALASATMAVSSALMAQAVTVWTVVRYPLDQSISVALVSPIPTGGGGKEDSPGIEPGGPGGRVQVLHDETHTTLDVTLRGLAEGKNYLYAIDGRNRATKLDEFGTSLKKTYALASGYDTFMLIVTRDNNLQSLPQRSRVVLYSAVPRTLPVVARPAP